MRRVLFLLLLCPLVSSGQDFTKQYVTTNGDTIRVHDVIRLSDAKAYHYIYLHTNLEQMRANAADRYLKTTMPGRTYSIARLSRIPAGKDSYKAIAVLRIQDPEIHRFMAVEYYIQLEEAL